MSEKYTGWLGWSNTRSGIDFYHSAEDGRHNHDPKYTGHGHLLAFDMMGDDGMHPLEGHKVVVIVGNDRAEEPEGAWFTPDVLAAVLREERILGDSVRSDADAALLARDILKAAKEAER